MSKKKIKCLLAYPEALLGKKEIHQAYQAVMLEHRLYNSIFSSY
jgi:hypothetical protein